MITAMTTPNPASKTAAITATMSLFVHLKRSDDGISLPDVMVIRQLLDAGAGINAQDERGMTPLLLCLKWRYHDQNTPSNFKKAAQDVLDLLLARGADMKATMPDGTTAANMAKRWRDANIAQKKLEREAYRRSQPELMAHVSRIDTAWPHPTDLAGQGTRTRFLRACVDGEHELAAYLAHIFPDAISWRYELKDHKNCTALMEAIRLGTADAAVKTTQLYIRKQADLNIQSDSGQSALHLAAARHADCIRLLIAAGADETLVNLRGYSAHDIAHHEAMNTTQIYLDALLEAIALRNQPPTARNDHASISQAAQDRLGALQASKKQSGVKFRL